MLFSDPVFLFVFLPVVLLVSFFWSWWRAERANKPGARSAIKGGAERTNKIWLLIASFVFCGYWSLSALATLLVSIVVNYNVGKRVCGGSTFFFVLGVLFNLLLLGYFKYMNFFLGIGGSIGALPLVELDIVLPLAISFYTFQQIAYLVDCRRGLVGQADFLTYSLFVSFFPQLIAGPIVHHKEMIAQFNNPAGRPARVEMAKEGVTIFAIGLAKKLVIADSLAPIANAAFDGELPSEALEAWIAVSAYTLQLYFDFSGYSDMAIGLGLLFGKRLPINFNSPLKAVNIKDFWDRWHITLSRWLRDYIYIPIGGASNGSIFSGLAVMATFLLGGLWHGAGWTFVLWGALNGIALIMFRAWKALGFDMPKPLAILVTLLFLMVSLSVFRSLDLARAIEMCVALVTLPSQITISSLLGAIDRLPLIFGSLWIVLVMPNSLEITSFVCKKKRAARARLSGVFVGTTLAAGALASLAVTSREFLYFDF